MTDDKKPLSMWKLEDEPELPQCLDLSDLLSGKPVPGGVYIISATPRFIPPLPITAHFKVYPDPDPMKLALEAFADSFSQQMKGAVNRFVDAFNGMADHLEHAGVIEPQPPSDPKERALWLRKNRNTGPEKKLNRRNRNQ